MQKTLLAAPFAGLVLASTAALAQPVQVRVTPYPTGPVRVLDPDEIRDYERDQLERRQEMEREALKMQQKVERRTLGLDD